MNRINETLQHGLGPESIGYSNIPCNYRIMYEIKQLHFMVWLLYNDVNNDLTCHGTMLS